MDTNPFYRKPLIVMIAIAMAASAVSLLPTAAADCHNGDPVDTLECTLNDLEAAAHNHLKAALGAPEAQTHGTTQCGAHTLDWATWTPHDDAFCAEHCAHTCTHQLTGDHKVGDSQAAPPGLLEHAPPGWFQRGELWVDGELVDTCEPDTTGPHPDACATAYELEAAPLQCIDVEAVTVLLNGSEARTSVTGPWSHC